MNPLLTVNLALLPILVFGLVVGWGHIGIGAGLGAALASVGALWHWRKRQVTSLELTIAATLAAIAASVAAGLELDKPTAATLGWAGLTLGTGASVLAGRPWTGDYSKAQYQGATKNPLFLSLNSVISSMWSLLLAWFAFASFEEMAWQASWLPMAIGSGVSFFLPNLWVRRHLQRQIDAQAPYKWPPPAFAASIAEADFDAIVVGAGIGGLTAAALLAQSGLRVLVCEQHSVPGGFAHTWSSTGQDGDVKPVFRFDAGVHDVSGVWDGAAVHGVLTRLGLANSVEWKRLQHRYLSDGTVFDVPPTWLGYGDAMAARFPADAVGLRDALADIYTIFKSMYSLGKQHSGVAGTPATPEDLLTFARQNPLAVQWMNQSFAKFLQARIASPAARDALTGLSGYISHDPALLRVADIVPLFGYYIHGGWYPLGGSGVIAQALVDAITLDGGELRLSTPVASALTENGAASGVCLVNGQTLRASAVVINSDFLTAVFELVDSAA